MPQRLSFYLISLELKNCIVSLKWVVDENVSIPFSTLISVLKWKDLFSEKSDC